MKKLAKKTIVKLSILTAVVIGSGLGVYGYAESVKEGQIKEHLVSQQNGLEHSLKKLYEEEYYQIGTIEQIKQTLAMYASKLEAIQGKTKTLTNENAQEIKANSRELAQEIAAFYDLVKIYEAQNTLFEEEILTKDGVNKEATLKKEVTLEKINDVFETVQANEQSFQLEDETKEVIAYAETQFTSKKAVDDWLRKNGKKYNEKNYRGLQELVEQVVPQSVRESYQSSVVSFKKGLDKKIADEKAAKEKAAKEKAAQIAQAQTSSTSQTENQVTTQQSSSGESTNGTNKNTNQPSASNSTNITVNGNSLSSQAATPAPAPEPRTDGFNFKGYHFDLSSFSGVGAVPQWTPYIYQWSDDPSHYLVEKASSAGSAIWNIGVGDTVVINGQTYTVFHVMRHVANDDNAYGVLKSQGATVTWQTCETADPNSALAIWYAY
ncbi:hypothetical protein ACYSNO_03550 [Enterococcus sp. LJL98]